MEENDVGLQAWQLDLRAHECVVEFLFIYWNYVKYEGCMWNLYLWIKEIDLFQCKRFLLAVWKWTKSKTWCSKVIFLQNENKPWNWKGRAWHWFCEQDWCLPSIIRGITPYFICIHQIKCPAVHIPKHQSSVCRKTSHKYVFCWVNVS